MIYAILIKYYEGKVLLHLVYSVINFIILNYDYYEKLPTRAIKQSLQCPSVINTEKIKKYYVALW